MKSKVFFKKSVSLILSICLILTAVFTISADTEETDSETLKAALDIAQSEYEAAKLALDEAESKAVFKEDFEGETKKLAPANTNALTETIEIDADGNNYAKITVKSGNAYYKSAKFQISTGVYYKVAVDYKASNVPTDAICLSRTPAAGGNPEAKEKSYLNNSTDWIIGFTDFRSPKYTVEETSYAIYFASDITGAQICIDNFMVFTESDYNTYIAAKENLAAKKTVFNEAKAAYEASLSPEELAYINAKEIMLNAKNTLETIESETCVFVENYEGETNKMGHRQSNNDTFIEQIVADGNNKYAKVTVKDGAAAASWYGIDMNNGATDHSKFAVEASTDYYIAFKYKTNSTSNVKLYRAATDLTNTTGANTNFAFVVSDDWTQAKQKITTASTHNEYFFYFQLLRNTGVELYLDDVTVVTVDGYDRLMQARAVYDKAVADCEEAKEALNALNAPMLQAKANFEEKQNAYNVAKEAYNTAAANDKYAFYEDYSDSDNIKMGYVAKGEAGTGSRVYTVDTTNGYAVLTATGTAWYGVSLSATQNYTAFAVTPNQEYILKFKYNAVSGDLQKFIKIFGTAASAGTSGEMIVPKSLTINGENKDNSISQTNGCKLNDYGLTSDWVDVEINFIPTKEYVYFYLHTVDGTVTYFDDIKVISKVNFDEIIAAQENLTAAKCDYAVSFEAYKPYVEDKLEQFTEVIEFCNAHYIENVCDAALKTKGTCITEAVYFKNCPDCGRLSSETFETDLDDTNHINTEYINISDTEKVLHCKDCDTNIKTEQIFGFADINCDGKINICDLVAFARVLENGEPLGENVDLNGDAITDQADFVIERNILLDCYENVTLDATANSNAPVNKNTFKAKDMWSALSVVADGGVVNNNSVYKITNENLELNTYGKDVTITGGTLDFTDKEIVNFRGNIELKDITVNWNTNAADSKVFANGYKVTIGENVTTNGMLNRIYGGAEKGTIDSTNLTLLSGSYNMIFGANEDGTVNGTANLYVGGNVNKELTDTDIKNHNLGKYSVYGGGRYNTSSVNNVKVTISDNAKMSKVYASGIAGTVTGKTELFFGGNAKAMSMYGGFYNPGSVSHTEVTMTGGWTEQIFGGNEKCGMTSANSTTKVTVTGGTVVRRIYGGCYNDYGLSGYESAYTVNGTTEVHLGGSLVMNSHSDGDNSIGAGSRYNNTNTETSTLYITQDLHNKYKSKIGAFAYGYDDIVIQ